MEQQSIKKNVVLSTIYQILLMISPIITTPYISRVLGPEGNGIYSYTHSYQIYFSMIAALGTASYGQREIARNRDDRNELSKLFWEIEFLTCITTGVSIMLWFFFISLQKTYIVIYLIMTLNLINTLFDISWFFSGLEQFQYIISINALFKILGIVLQLVLVKDKQDIAVYICILCVTTLMGTMSMWLALPKFLEKISFRNINILRHFKETLIYFIPTISISVYTVLDKTLIGLITNDPKENGYYEQANKVIGILKSLTFVSLNNVLGPRNSYLYTNNKFDEIKLRIMESIEYILFIGIGICFGLIAISDRFVIWFFGNDFSRVAYILIIFSPIIVIIGISNCLEHQYYTPAGFRKKSAYFILIGAGTNFALNLFLIPQYGSYGAAFASVVAEVVITVLYIKYCNGFLTLKALINKMWKKLVGALVMFSAMEIFGNLKVSDLLSITLQLIIGGCLYIGLLLLLNDSFTKTLMQYLKRRIIKK